MARRGLLGAGVLLMAAIGVSCAPAMSPFTLQGRGPALTWLDGKWEGTFSAAGSFGIAGTLRLEVRRGGALAYGEVRTATAPGRPAQVLTVRRILMTGLVLEGELDPFVDPECACLAWATFSARLRDDRLDGRYTVRLATGDVRKGRWHADRHVRQRGWFRWGGE